METFHIDIWTPNITSLTISLNGVEKVYTPAMNAWNSYDIELADFGSPTTLNANGIEFKAQPFAAGVLYYDNIYFHKKPATGVKKVELSNVSVYPNPVNKELNISLDQSDLEYNVEISNATGQNVYAGVIAQGVNTTSINVDSFKKGIYFVKISNADASTVKKIVKK
jgi:hypothetical protein